MKPVHSQQWLALKRLAYFENSEPVLALQLRMPGDRLLNFLLGLVWLASNWGQPLKFSEHFPTWRFTWKLSLFRIILRIQLAAAPVSCSCFRCCVCLNWVSWSDVCVTPYSYHFSVLRLSCKHDERKVLVTLYPQMTTICWFGWSVGLIARGLFVFLSWSQLFVVAAYSSSCCYFHLAFVRFICLVIKYLFVPRILSSCFRVWSVYFLSSPQTYILFDAVSC